MKQRRINERSILFWIDTRLYSEQVVFKCFYWYMNQYSVEISLSEDGSQYLVTLEATGAISPAMVETLEQRVRNNLLDFKTREIVARETESIRQILLAKAFAPGQVFDEPPRGDISDPVGFEINQYD